MPGRVVHCRREPFDVYIGRRVEGLIWTYDDPWGNPFYFPGQRERAVEAYRKWVDTQPRLLARLPELRGKVLGCWCRPAYRCHGEVLLRLANPSEGSDMDRLMAALLEGNDAP